jgi:hypothetical protein
VGVQGGVCLRTAGFDVCYPRIGCNLVTEGETCVDGAPVMLDELDPGELCEPWVRAACSLGDAACAAGICHPTEGGLGLCGAASECGHWIECGMGELCVGGRCRPYTVQAALADVGNPCDGRPYGALLQGGVIWTSSAAAGNALCLLADDPRCAGRPPGQTCDWPLDRYQGKGRSPMVCSTQGACIEAEALDSCSSAPGQACTTAAGHVGRCESTLRGLRCVP